MAKDLGCKWNFIERNEASQEQVNTAKETMLKTLMQKSMSILQNT